MPSLPRRRVLPLALVVVAFLLPPAFGPGYGPLGLTSGRAQDDPLRATTRTVNVELILDASGSMAEVLPKGETRMDAAKRILRGVIEIAEQDGGHLFEADDAAELGTAIGLALEGVGGSVRPVAIPAPRPAVPPAAPAVPLSEIRTLAYHQLTQWTTGANKPGEDAANERGEEAPILSDDGQRIAFARAPESGASADPTHFFVMNADGSGEQEVDAYPSLGGSAWMIDLSADGVRIVSSDSMQLRVAEASGGGGRELLALESNELNAVRISGDGSTIVFRISQDTMLRNTSPSQSIARGIYRINVDGSGLRQLVGPDALGALFSVTPEQAPLFVGGGVDVSANGAQIVFTSDTTEFDPDKGGVREGLFAVNGDGSGLHRLLGPTFSFVQANAISGDGATVAYVTLTRGSELQQAGVLGFDGSDQRILTDSTSLHPGTRDNLPLDARIQLSSDGSRLLLGSTGLLYDTTTGDALALGVGTPWFSTDPAPLVSDGLYQATMNATATRALYLLRAYPEPSQLVRLDLNPTDLGGAPAITDPRLTPAYVLTEGRSTATVSARVSTTNTLVRVSSRVLRRDGLPDDTTRTDPLLDDGAGTADAVSGDVTANDGLFTSNGLYTDRCAEVGPRTVRIKAETQTPDGLRHATAIDVSPFQVSTTPVEGGPPPAAPAPATPAPSTRLLSVDVVVARAQAAVQCTGTYRFALTVNGDPEQTESSADNPWGSLTWGAVDILKGIRRQSPDGAEVAYYDNHAVYSRGPEGMWFVYAPGRGYDEPLLQFLNEQANWWQLKGTAVVDGTAAYILQRHETEARVQFWIDAATFVPLKRTTQRTEPRVETETIFFDFGAPVDVRVPPEAAASLFVQTILGGDFASVQGHFAPENQPATWHDIFTRTSEQTAVDVLPCRDVASDVVTRPGALTGVDRAEVSVVFADPCIQTREGQERVRSDTMLLTLEYREGQWDVQRVAVPR